jgi:glycosyltransferase involved in cell wall biosynthesis
MNQPLVSVIIPVFNAGPFIKETLNSVIAQTYRDIEIIVINDGSTDNSLEAIRSIGDRRINVQSIPNSGGPARPRNNGMKMAHGEYIAFLDSDDIWLPSKLEKQVSFLQGRPEVGLVYPLYQHFDENGDEFEIFPRERRRFSGGGEKFFQYLLKESEIPTSGILMRRELTEKIGLFDEHPLATAVEDFDYLLRASFFTSAACLEEVLLKYRRNPTSISKASLTTKMRRLQYVYCKHRNHMSFFIYWSRLARFLLYYVKLLLVGLFNKKSPE